MTERESLPTSPHNDRSLPQEIARSLKLKSDEPALIVDGKTWTGAEFLSAASTRIAQLHNEGVVSGDVIMVKGERGGQFWIDVFALWCLDAVYAPIGDGVSPDVVDKIASPRFFLGNGNEPSPLASAPAIPPPPDATSADRSVEITPRQPGNLSTIIFTSGSTGTPKGVMLSDAAVLANAVGALACLDFEPGDRLFVPVPFRFASALSHFVAACLSPAALATTEEPLLPNTFATRFKEMGGTVIGGSPTHVRWLAESGSSAFPGLRWIMSSGDNLSVAIIHAVAAARPDVGVYTFYGLSELGGRFCCLRAEEQADHAGSVGRPMPEFSLQIVGDDDEPVAPGSEGEVIAWGPGMMAGYMNDPDATNDVLFKGGFRTGDLGRLDEHGLLRLSGRKGDVFKVVGKKAHAMVIQDAVIKSGMVEDAAVMPFEDPNLGTVPCLYYVPVDKATFKKGLLLKSLRETLESHMLPRKFVEVETVPRTRSGKINRPEMRRLAAESQV